MPPIYQDFLPVSVSSISISVYQLDLFNVNVFMSFYIISLNIFFTQVFVCLAEKHQLVERNHTVFIMSVSFNNFYNYSTLGRKRHTLKTAAR